MNEYIIKNCPCLFDSYYASGKTVRFECNDGNHDDKLCRDVTDCVMKQIVEKCKKYIENYNDKVFYDDDDVKILMGKVMLSQSILCEILKIQEVE